MAERDSILYEPDDKPAKGTYMDELERERQKLEIAFADIDDWIRSNDKQFIFENSSYSGQAGGEPVSIRIFVANGQGVPDPVSVVLGVSVFIQGMPLGTVIISEPMPLKFERVRTAEGKLEYFALVHISNNIPETITLGLIDSEGTRLDVSDTCTVTFA